MVKVVAAALLATASAGTLSVTFADCGDASTHAKVTDVSPKSIESGSTTKVSGTGDLDEDVNGASFSATIKASGVTVASCNGPADTSVVCKLPLGAGSITLLPLTFPLKAGTVTLGTEVQLSSLIPASLAKTNVHIDGKSDTGDSLVCLDINTEKQSLGAAEYEAAWAEFQAAQGPRNGDIPQAFKNAVDTVMEHNSQDSTFKLSYTGPFADKTPEEYKAVLGYKPQALFGDLPKIGTHSDETEPAVSSIDWSTKGAVTPVKDQGQCGSCWAFSSTGSTEGQWEIASGSLKSMSEQQLVDCSKQNSGCNGGLMDYAFAFYEGTSVATESSYPYTARDGSCKSSYTTAIPKGGVTGYKDVSSESALLNAVTNVGPTSVAIEADQSSFQYYSSGVLTGSCGTSLDHGVLAVGFGTSGGTDYWKVKNSWGASWGMNGYVLIQRGVNKCGIADGPPSYPTVSGSLAMPEQGDCGSATCQPICECAFDQCATETSACLADSGCAAKQSCAFNCACGDSACMAACAADDDKASAVAGCIKASCSGGFTV